MPTIVHPFTGQVVDVSNQTLRSFQHDGHSIEYLTSPTTGRVIKRGGPAYKHLLEEGIEPEGKPVIYKPEPKHTRHEHETDAYFCGPLAGLKKTSYPVNSSGRAHSAMGRAGNAASHGADPEIIAKCACNSAFHQNWFECHKYTREQVADYIPEYPNGEKAW